MRKRTRNYTKAHAPVKPIVGEEERLVADQRRAKVADLFLGGTHLSVIAKTLLVTMETVKRDLAVIRKEWIGKASEEILAKRGERLALLDKLISAAWLGWERSLEPRTVTSATKVGPGGQPVTRATTYKRDGDPRFLALIAKYIDQQTRLLGLNLQADDPVVPAFGSQITVVLPENFRSRPKQIESSEVRRESHVE